MFFKVAQPNIPARSLRQNLRLGEEVLHEFRQEFPVLHSNTRLLNRFENNISQATLSKLSPKMDPIVDKYSKGIGSLRTISLSKVNVPMTYFGRLKYYFSSSSKRKDYFDAFINRLKLLMQEKKYANCGEQSAIAMAMLIKKGEKPCLINIIIIDKFTNLKKPGGDHAFVVYGLNKAANNLQYRTWGQKAVILDPWSNTVMKASDGINYFKQILGFDSTKQVLCFYSADDLPIWENALRQQK